MMKTASYTYGNESPAQELTLFLPDGEIKSVFVYIHGGGLVDGDKSHADVSAPYLTSRGIALATINYRMYPEAKYPDFIYDSALAVRWVVDNVCKVYGADKLYVGGSSAGGYISMMLCYDKTYLESVGLDMSAIAGYFHDAGQPTAHFTVLDKRGIDPRRVIVDETSPLYHIGAADKYPRCRFIISDNDMPSRYEQTMLVLSTLKHYGHSNYDHVVMHGDHCAYVTATDENGDGVLGKMIYDFIESAE